jgi:hypothetical protein
MCPSAFPWESFTCRTSSVSVSRAYRVFGAPGTTLPATVPWWQARQLIVHLPAESTTYWSEREGSSG